MLSHSKAAAGRRFSHAGKQGSIVEKRGTMGLRLLQVFLSNVALR